MSIVEESASKQGRVRRAPSPALRRASMPMVKRLSPSGDERSRRRTCGRCSLSRGPRRHRCWVSVVRRQLGGLLERTLYRPLYKRPHLDQVLFSIGLTFMAVASANYLVGSTQQIVQLPEWLKGRTEIGEGAWMLGMGHYRLFIIAVCAALTLGLQFVLARTRFGSRLRAAVDDQRVAAGLGINVNWVFLGTFAVGSGLAGLGGALGAEVLGLDPSFPLKYMIYFLIVVAVGGTTSITGPLLAALLLGIADVAGKYYIPKLGAFIVYALMIAILIWRPQGLFVRQGGK